ncbi:MAG: cupin domain-containing protein [Acidocella sp.]|nr:cupin domain-containing protein [Acidocella sp.]
MPLPLPADAAWEPVAHDKIIAGTPQTRLWVHYHDQASGLSAGEWEAGVGAWRITYTEWEYVRVISGRCVITGDDGSRFEAGPGDGFVIEPGFTGVWEVLNPMRKHWVIRE